MALIDKLREIEKEIGYKIFRAHLLSIIRSSVRLVKKRDLDKVVRPYVFSYIFNRGVGLTTSLVVLSNEGKFKGMDYNIFIHDHYKPNFTKGAQNVIWYQDREELFRLLSNCDYTVALVDIYNLDQESFRQYISNNYNRANRLIITFSTHGFV